MLEDSPTAASEPISDTPAALPMQPHGRVPAVATERQPDTPVEGRECMVRGIKAQDKGFAWRFSGSRVGLNYWRQTASGL